MIRLDNKYIEIRPQVKNKLILSQINLQSYTLSEVTTPKITRCAGF
jgi:hypothetical protein